MSFPTNHLSCCDGVIRLTSDGIRERSPTVSCAALAGRMMSSLSLPRAYGSAQATRGPNRLPGTLPYFALLWR